MCTKPNTRNSRKTENFVVQKMVCRKATSLAERIKSEVIGIDLGTTNSAVAIFKNGVSCAPEILTNFDGMISFHSSSPKIVPSLRQ